MTTREPLLDCLIFGGGPAGLTAAIYLARFLLSAMVYEDGKAGPVSFRSPAIMPGSRPASPPLPKAPHARSALPANIYSKQRSEAVPPVPDGFVADVDAAFVQQILDVSQRQREPSVHEGNEADHLWRGVEAAERAGG